ncbi:mycofactocin-coupled SDR family oxidoreductase [Rhodococcus koreensis]
MTESLTGKVAFVTGAARGQGRAHCVALAHAGANIVAVDIAAPIAGAPYDPATPADLAETARLVEAEGKQIMAEQHDVRDLGALADLTARAMDNFGSIDVAVANAGICLPATWDAVTPQNLRDTLDINVVGVWNTVMAAAPHMVAQRNGSIIMISSYAGKKLQPFMIPYTTSKHAVTGMTRAFAAELGQYGIRVNSIHPGAVNTPMGSGDMQATLAAAGESNPPLNNMGSTFLTEGAAESEQISDAVVFLASSTSSFITAEHISIDGGAQYF